MNRIELILLQYRFDGIPLIRLIRIFIIVFCAFLITPSLAQSEDTKKILILNSYHLGYCWSDNIMEGIKSEFDKTDFKIELWHEYMDTLRNKPDQLFPYLENLYKEKFRNRKFDVIIVSDNNALDFLLARREKLFPQVPIVFTGINNFDESMIQGHEAVTGVTEDVDIKRTIELILRNHPDTEKIVVIADSTLASHLNLQKLRSTFQTLNIKGVTFVELTDWNRSTLKHSIRKLTENTVLLTLSMSRDYAGENFMVEEGLKLVTDFTDLPIYTLWDSFIGLGPVGGVVTSGRLQGEHAARMAARYLHGDSSVEIPIIRSSPNTPMFDYARLRQFGIALSDLPEGSVIANEPDSFYYRHKTLIWTITLFVVVQALIILALAINIKRREEAESELRESTDRYMRIFNGAEVPIFEQDFSDAVRLIKMLKEEGFTSLRNYLREHKKVARRLANKIIVNDANESAQRMFRADSKQELLSNISRIHAPIPIETYIDTFCAIWEEKKSFRTECLMTALDGRELAVILSMPVPTTLEESLRIPVSVFDITDRKQIELSLHKLSSAVEQSGSAVMITDRKGIIEYVNPRFTEVTGYAAQEVIGETPLIFRPLEKLASLKQDLWTTILGGDDWRGELRDRRKDGELYWALTSISPIQNDVGKITHFVAVSEDVTELKETQMKMEQFAFYDTLTGLENRRLFRERLEQAIKVAQRSEKSVALLYLDLDQFKRINDTLGHDAGDTLLIKVADRLRACVRDEDTVARIGGDEFMVLLPDVDGSTGVNTVAQKIVSALQLPLKLPTQEIIVTTSIGITLAPDDGIDAEILMKNADLAMYRAKERGRNNYQFFVEEMNAEASERLFLENELRRALEQQQFSVYYQPLISVRSQQVVTLEALLRWEHPELGLITPDRFISVAEDTGLIIPLGIWLLRTACRQIKEMHVSGLPPTKIAVNLSARQFREPALSNTISEILRDTDLEGTWLDLELTESVLMETTDEAINIMTHLRALGVSISIDDFGTGYSSLSYLKRFPIDTVKIDRSFVRDIPSDPNDVEITTAVIAMAHKLHLKAVAEGVETPEQLAFLEENHADYVQGNMFSHPVPYHQATNILRGEIRV